MDIKSLRELVFLLGLYTEKHLTLKRIQKISGLKSKRLVYSLRNRLMKDNMIVENGVSYIRSFRGRGFEVLYEVNHKRLDEFLVKESPLWHFYSRIAKGHIGVWPVIKPNQDKISRWTNNSHASDE